MTSSKPNVQLPPFFKEEPLIMCRIPPLKAPESHRTLGVGGSVEGPEPEGLQFAC